MSLETMKLIYFSYFHSLLPYRIIFWRNSVHSKYIFKIQKRTIRITTNAGIGDSCQNLFKKLQILHFYSHLIYSLLLSVVKNRNLFKLNSDIHGFSTRCDNDFHLPSAKLKLFQRAVLYSGIKTHSHLPKTIKELSHDVKQFSLAVRDLLYQISFILWKSILTLTGNE